MDIRVNTIFEKIRMLSIQTFSENLVGIYVHGSLALECFSWDNSDIDFIVVVKDLPTMEQKIKYMTGILEINKIAPPKGLEMSIVLEKNTRQFVYPTPFELHFSNAHLKWCSDSLNTYCQNMNGTDKDLAAHFTIINKACIVLYGKSVNETFGVVPKDNYFDSIKCDIENADEEVTDNPIYIVLNLCRVLAYKYDGLVLSKKGGGIWGIEHIPKEYSGIIETVLNAYINSLSINVEDNKEALISLAQYVLKHIFD